MNKLIFFLFCPFLCLGQQLPELRPLDKFVPGGFNVFVTTQTDVFFKSTEPKFNDRRFGAGLMIEPVRWFRGEVSACLQKEGTFLRIKHGFGWNFGEVGVYCYPFYLNGLYKVGYNTPVGLEIRKRCGEVDVVAQCDIYKDGKSFGAGVYYNFFNF